MAELEDYLAKWREDEVGTNRVMYYLTGKPRYDERSPISDNIWELPNKPIGNPIHIYDRVEVGK